MTRFLFLAICVCCLSACETNSATTYQYKTRQSNAFARASGDGIDAVMTNLSERAQKAATKQEWHKTSSKPRAHEGDITAQSMTITFD